jgi:hypothetical protein
MEFGMVDSIVKNVSLVPIIDNAERFYMVEMELTN